MPDVDDIHDAITQSAVDGIKKQKVGNEETEALPVADQIAAATFAASNDAGVKANPHKALRFARTVVRSD
jgi:hypothetical protein